MRSMAWLSALLLFLGTLGVLQTLYAPTAAACSCAPKTVAEQAEDLDLVAEIRPVDALPGADGKTTYPAEVHTVWKGAPPATITISTTDNVVSCGLGKLTVGERLVVWANGSGDTYSTSWCNLPTDAKSQEDGLEKLEAILGPPRQIEQPSPGATPPGTTPPPSEPSGTASAGWLWGSIAVGTAGLLVLALALLGRRR